MHTCKHVYLCIAFKTTYWRKPAVEPARPVDQTGIRSLKGGRGSGEELANDRLDPRGHGHGCLTLECIAGLAAHHLIGDANV